MTEAQDLSHFVRRPADGVAAMDLVVDGVYCGACIVTIEKGLRRQAGVRGARVNLASKRVTVEWSDGALDPPVILERLEALGYPAYPFAAETVDSVEIRDGEAAPALPRRRGLRRDERHAAVDLAVGGRRQRPEFGDPRSLPLAVGPGRPAHGGLRRPAVLRERGEGAPRAVGQHGRADHARRRARARHVDAADARPRARRLFRQRADAADVPARRALSRPADAPAHARLRDQSVGDPRRPRRQAVRRGRSARDADRGDPSRRSRARARRRAHRRRRRGRGRAFGDRPEPGDRRDGADRGFPGRAGLRRDRQSDRRPARPGRERRERNPARRGQRPARERRSSSAPPTCASPTARRSSTCRSSM